MVMNQSEKKKFIREISDSVKNKMLQAVDEGKIPEEWDGYELRHWMLSIVKYHVAHVPLEGKRKKDFKNHLRVTPEALLRGWN